MTMKHYLGLLNLGVGFVKLPMENCSTWLAYQNIPEGVSFGVVLQNTPVVFHSGGWFHKTSLGFLFWEWFSETPLAYFIWGWFYKASPVGLILEVVLRHIWGDCFRKHRHIIVA